MMGRVHIDRFTNRAIILVIATISSTHSHKQTHTHANMYLSVCTHKYKQILAQNFMDVLVFLKRSSCVF